MANTEIAQKNVNTLRQLLDKSKNEIMNALPKHMDSGRLARIALTTCQKNPKLLECSPRSVIAGIITSAQLGLEPDNILGSAYLVPFYNGKTKQLEAQLIPGYKGLIDLARRSGQIQSISAHIVYENEKCELNYGTENKINHIPLPPSERGDRKIGVYAVATFKDGGYQFEWLWKEDVEKIRDSSKNYKDKDGKVMDWSTWVQYEEEMWKKTAIRRLCKYLPLSPELSKAVSLEEHNNAGLSQQNTADVFGDALETEAEQYDDNTENKKEQLKEKLGSKKEEDVD